MNYSSTKSFRIISQFLPAINWFQYFNFHNVRADLVSGLTVALVLIPQSMAYAQLAGLPPYYGLYAAFLPPVVAAVFGSSYQLATGPVAVVSLMTSTALAPLATAGSDSYIAYAIILALCVGIFQFLLGVLKLGLVINFLSHPVVNGFTNAAALIIASSQLSKLFGVEVDRYEHHYETIYNVIKEAINYTHLPTLGLAVLAFALMYFLKRLNPKLPNVLIAVVVTILISKFSGFEKNATVDIDEIISEEFHHSVANFNHSLAERDSLLREKVRLSNHLKSIIKEKGKYSDEAIKVDYNITLLEQYIERVKERIQEIRREIRGFRFVKSADEQGPFFFYRVGHIPSDMKMHKRRWRVKVGNMPLQVERIKLIGGGAVVGTIPQGLPKISSPKLDLGIMFDLLTMAIIISILGFMEAISIAKAIASRTGQKLDPNQELIGQGLANIVGSFSNSYPVSGSFSRSAVNFQSGAVTGLSSVFSSLVVMITLLFFTPMLYHLPQSVLAAIIMMAVIGLVNIKGFIHAYQAQKYDGIIAVITFVFTLAFAPHLDRGIMIGVALSIGLFLFRNIKPDMAILSLYIDGTYRNADRRGLQKCRHIAVVRFNNSLFFANVNYLEDKILELISTWKELRHVHIVCNGINELDASGEATLSVLVKRLREKNIGVSLSGVNENVLDVLVRTHLLSTIGEDNIFGNVAMAVKFLHDSTHRNSTEEKCPLLEVVTKGLAIAPDIAKKFKFEMEKWEKPDIRQKLDIKEKGVDDEGK